MPFNYETLKRLQGDAVIDQSLTSDDIKDGDIDADKLDNSSISSAQLADAAVNLSGNKVTGSLAVNKGGTGLSGISGAYQAVTTSGSNNTLRPHGIYGMQVFTGNGTWNRPSNVRYIKVQVVGGGGGGSGHGEAGGSGGYAEEIINVESISSVPVTIGGGGGSSYYSGAGGNGGASSFGPYVSASLGYGANRNNQHSGGVSGVGSGGNLNIHGGGGGNHHQRSGKGGGSYWGGSTAGGHPQGGQFAYNHRNHAGPGAGGAGGYFNGNRGAIGKAGMVVVTMFY